MRVESLDRVLVDNFSVHLMADFLAKVGVDPHPLLEECGLTWETFNDPEVLVTGMQEVAFQRQFVALTDQRWDLWVKMAQRYRIPSMGPWGLALITSPSLATLFDLIPPIAEVNYSLVKSRSFEVDNATNCLLYNFDEVPDDLVDFVKCRDFVAVTNFFHDLWHGCFPFVCIETPLSAEKFAGFDFKASVKFGSDRTAWLWPAELADSAPAFSDVELHQTYLRKSMSRVARGRTSNPLLDRIDALLENREDSVTLPELSEHLNMSERVLQRRLAESGVTVRSLLNERKKSIAQKLLLQTDTSISEVAYKAGYGDSSSFSHAFKRWTGVNPSVFRRAAKN